MQEYARARDVFSPPFERPLSKQEADERDDPTLISYPRGLQVNFGRLSGDYPNATDVKAIPPEVSGVEEDPQQRLATRARLRIEAVYNQYPPVILVTSLLKSYSVFR